MDSICGPDILKLAALLNTNFDKEDDFEDDQQVKSSAKATPADLAKPNVVRVEDTKRKEILKENTDDFDLDKLEPAAEWRKSPRWDLIYKQSVTPCDIYLQMSAKTQLTSSCEEMVITVELPGDKGPNIDVKVLKDHLHVQSPQHNLSVPLPQPVDPQKGNAKWDSEAEKLVLTLVMDREFDYINF